MPEAVGFVSLGGILGFLAIVVWWAFFSRAPRIERWGGVVLIIVALVSTWLFLHESLKLMPFVAYIIPILSLAFVVWAVASSRLSLRPRRMMMVGTILLACGVWTLLRTGGITGDFQSIFNIDTCFSNCHFMHRFGNTTCLRSVFRIKIFWFPTRRGYRSL